MTRGRLGGIAYETCRYGLEVRCISEDTSRHYQEGVLVQDRASNQSFRMEQVVES